MSKYSIFNAENVLAKVEEHIDNIGRQYRNRYEISDVCKDLSIFDWWNDFLSLTQLKAMRAFLKTAIRLGYTGYVCFKVGASGCASGMWAYKAESETGYSPDGACVYRSFYSSKNYYDFCDDGGNWYHSDGHAYDSIKTVRQLEEAIAC